MNPTKVQPEVTNAMDSDIIGVMPRNAVNITNAEVTAIVDTVDLETVDVVYSEAVGVVLTEVINPETVGVMLTTDGDPDKTKKY